MDIHQALRVCEIRPVEMTAFEATHVSSGPVDDPWPSLMAVLAVDVPSLVSLFGRQVCLSSPCFLLISTGTHCRTTHDPDTSFVFICLRMHDALSVFCFLRDGRTWLEAVQSLVR